MVSVFTRQQYLDMCHHFSGGQESLIMQMELKANIRHDYRMQSNEGEDNFL